MPRPPDFIVAKKFTGGSELHIIDNGSGRLEHIANRGGKYKCTIIDPKSQTLFTVEDVDRAGKAVVLKGSVRNFDDIRGFGWKDGTKWKKDTPLWFCSW